MAYSKKGQSGAYTVLRTNANGYGIDVGTLSDGSISNTEFGYLSGISGNIQSQLNDAFTMIDTGAVSFEVRTAMTLSMFNPTSSTPIIGLPDGSDMGGIDFNDLNEGDRILVAIGNSSTGSAYNGIWEWHGDSAPLTRVSDYDDWGNVVGSRVFPTEGNSAGRAFINLNLTSEAGTIGTTAIKYRVPNDNIQAGDSLSYTSNQTLNYVGGLSDQNDVTLSSLNAGDLLVYNSSSSEWQNVAVGGEGTIDENGNFILSNAAVIGKTLDNFSEDYTNDVSSSDSIESAIDKLGGIHNRTVNTTNASSSLDVAYKINLVSTDSTTQTLPDATAVKVGLEITVKNIGSVTTTTVDSAGGNIDGASSQQVLGAYSSLTFISDGNDWFMI